MIKFVSIITLFLNFSWSSGSDYFFESRNKNKNKNKKQNYFIVNGIRISETRECKRKACFAYQIAANKISVPKEIIWISGGVNPTSTLCKNMQGDPKIGFTTNGNEISLCYFNDQSFIFAWDLMKLSAKQR